jgi:manganese transport protein
MGEFVNPLWIKIVGWLTVWIVIILNVKLLFDTLAPDPARKAIYGALGLPIPS